MNKRSNKTTDPRIAPKNVPPANTVAAAPAKGMSVIMKYALFLGIVAFCIYASTMQHGYVLDDLDMIQNNTLVKKGISAIPEILATPFHHGIATQDISRGKDDQYRPLPVMMFTLEYSLFGDNPAPGHIVNVLLYAACIMLLFIFLYHLFRKERPVVAFIGALLFAIHPIHTEVVANIKSRDELLCFLFGFLALIKFIHYSDTGKLKHLLAGLAFYLLSLLSKETSITFLAVIPFMFFFYNNDNKKRSLVITLVSFLPALIYLGLRFSVLTKYHVYNTWGVSFYENPLVAAPSAASRLATEILILGNYIRLLILPYPLICDYSYNAIPFTGFNNIWVWLSLIVYAALLLFGIYRLLKKRNDPLAFGALFFLITITLFSNIAVLIGAEMADRFMFFPSLGFCIVAAFIIEQLALKIPAGQIGDVKNKKILMILVPLSLVYTGVTIARNADWKDNFTLYSADSGKSPDNARLQYFLAIEKFNIAQNRETDQATRHQLYLGAIKDLQKCVSVSPGFYEAQNYLALVFMSGKHLDSAEVHSKKAVALSPGNAYILNILVDIYVNEQKYQDAIDLLRKAAETNHTDPIYYTNIGVCYIYSRNFDSALHYLRKGMEIDPAYDRAIRFSSEVFNITGQKDSAKKYETMAQRSDPQFKVDDVTDISRLK